MICGTNGVNGTPRWCGSRGLAIRKLFVLAAIDRPILWRAIAAWCPVSRMRKRLGNTARYLGPASFLIWWAVHASFFGATG